MNVSPPDTITNVPVNARVRVLFDTVVSAFGIEGSIVLSAGGFPVSGSSALDLTRTLLEFVPDASLATSTLYSADIAGATDLAGNLVAPVSTSFTTAASGADDTTGPTPFAMAPANGATGVPVGTTIVLNYDEVIDSTSVNAASIVVAVPAIT